MLPQTRDIKKLEHVMKQHGEVQYYRRNSMLEHVIRSQKKAAERKIRPRHFYRFLPEQSNPAAVQRETSTINRKYAEPTVIRLGINQDEASVPMDSRGKQTLIGVDIVVDLAECIALGEHFGIIDVTEDFPYHFYLPKSGDVFQWNRSLYRITDISPKRYYEPVSLYITWEGRAEQLTGDANQVDLLPIFKKDPKVNSKPYWKNNPTFNG